MEVTSDIRHLVSTMSENMSTTPMTSSRSSPHSGSNSAAEPTSTKAHSQQLQQQMNNLQEVAQFPAHMIANQNAPRANETKINKNSRPVSVDLHPGDSGDNMSCHSQSSQNAANGVFVAPLAINSQAQSRNQQQSSKSSVRRVGLKFLLEYSIEYLGRTIHEVFLKAVPSETFKQVVSH